MRFIRLLGVVVTFYGLSYLIYAQLQIVNVVLSGVIKMSYPLIIGLNLTVGLVTLVNGIGLLLARKFFRIAWLVTVTVLVLVHDLILLLTYVSGQNLTQQVFNVLLIFFLAVISWSKLTDSATKKYFV